MTESEEYRLSGSEMVRLATEEYVRQFWWYVAIVPLFGLIAVIFGDGTLRLIGGMAVLWPLSIPARSVVSTVKARRLFSTGVRARLEADGLYLVPLAPGLTGLRLKWSGMRDVLDRGQWSVVRTRRFGFLPVPAGIGREIAGHLRARRG